MKVTSHKNKGADSYLKLVMEFPLRPIRSDKEYDEAFNIIETLAIRGENDLDAGEYDYLDALGDFVTLSMPTSITHGQRTRARPYSG